MELGSFLLFVLQTNVLFTLQFQLLSLFECSFSKREGQVCSNYVLSFWDFVLRVWLLMFGMYFSFWDVGFWFSDDVCFELSFWLCDDLVLRLMF